MYVEINNHTGERLLHTPSTLMERFKSLKVELPAPGVLPKIPLQVKGSARFENLGSVPEHYLPSQHALPNGTWPRQAVGMSCCPVCKGSKKVLLRHDMRFITCFECNGVGVLR